MNGEFGGTGNDCWGKTGERKAHWSGPVLALRAEDQITTKPAAFMSYSILGARQKGAISGGVSGHHGQGALGVNTPRLIRPEGPRRKAKTRRFAVSASGHPPAPSTKTREFERSSARQSSDRSIL